MLMSRIITNIKFKVIEHSWLARIAAWKLGTHSVAIVFGNSIHLCHTHRHEFFANEAWLKHELCHIRQYKQHGFFNFLFKYVWESIKKGYYNNKYEVEARAAEKETQQIGFACLLN
jgi:hypothetical protein